MSVTIEKPQTALQRTKTATTQLLQTLNVENVQWLTTALAEVALEEVAANRTFSSKLLHAYQEIAKSSKPTPKKKIRELANLTPIAKVDESEFLPLGTVKPKVLLKLYGAAQLPIALDQFTLVMLKDAAHVLMEEYPGTKPKSMANKADVIAYIIDRVSH